MSPFNPEIIKAYRELGAWGDRSIAELFLATMQKWPRRIALIDDPTREMLVGTRPEKLSYAELGAAVNQMSACLKSHGLQKGDIVLTQLPNIWEVGALLLVGAATGIIISPAPMQYRHKELSDIVRTLAPNAVITTSKFKNTNPAQLFVDDVVKNNIAVFRISNTGDDVGQLFDWRSFATSSSNFEAEVSPDEVLTVCWTSGTEAEPKGVVRTHNNWLTTGKGIAAAANLKPGYRILNPFPFVNMASIGGLFMPWIVTEGTLVLHHPFDLSVMLQQMREDKVNYTVLAPSLLNRILKESGLVEHLNTEHLEGLGTGSAPPDAWMMKAFQEEHGIPITNFFGSNEGVSLTSGADDMPEPVSRARLFPRAGRPQWKWRNPAMNWSETVLIDIESGEEIDEVGVAGELRISGPSVFPGYYQAGETTPRGFDENGYYCSGDLFEIAELNGEAKFYKYVGRVRELIIRGGMNISPVEIDSALADHPNIKDAAVVGYPDPDLGEKICVFIVLMPDVDVNLQDVVEHLQMKGLAKYKFPEKLRVLEQLPRNPVNKVMRRDLEKMVKL